MYSKSGSVSKFWSLDKWYTNGRVIWCTRNYTLFVMTEIESLLWGQFEFWVSWTDDLVIFSKWPDCLRFWISSQTICTTAMIYFSLFQHHKWKIISQQLLSFASFSFEVYTNDESFSINLKMRLVLKKGATFSVIQQLSSTVSDSKRPINNLLFSPRKVYKIPMM